MAMIHLLRVIKVGKGSRVTRVQLHPLQVHRLKATKASRVIKLGKGSRVTKVQLHPLQVHLLKATKANRVIKVCKASKVIKLGKANKVERGIFSILPRPK